MNVISNHEFLKRIKKCRCCGERRAIYGCEVNVFKDKTPLFCHECRTDKMYQSFIGKRICVGNECNNIGVCYAKATDPYLQYCGSCVPSTLLYQNYFTDKVKCIECNIWPAEYNDVKISFPLWCDKCKGHNMVNKVIYTNKCIKCRMNQALYGKLHNRKPYYCEECVVGIKNYKIHMVNLYKRGCISDGCNNQGDLSYDNYCSLCYMQLYPICKKTLELKNQHVLLAIVKMLTNNFPEFVRRKCTYMHSEDNKLRKRLMFRNLIDKTNIVIQTNEDIKNKPSIKVKDEFHPYKRYLGGKGYKWIFIRINFGVFTTRHGRRKNPRINKRIDVLRKELDKQIQRVFDGENEETIETVYLYYDEISDSIF